MALAPTYGWPIQNLSEYQYGAARRHGVNAAMRRGGCTNLALSDDSSVLIQILELLFIFFFFDHFPAHF